MFSEAEIYGIESDRLQAEQPGQNADDTVEETPQSEEIALSEEFRKPKQKLRFMSFGSGSSGNCSYIGTSDTGLLIDAGVDCNFVMAELARNGIKASSIRGIFLTHDHGDHVKYAYTMVRKQPRVERPDGKRSGWQLFATPRTIEGILRRHNLSRRIRDYHSAIFKEHEYTFGDIRVVPFETSHDGADNTGYFITCGEARFVVCTDTGIITERADHYLRQATSIMIESNYDNDMLTLGRYPEYLKARIRSEKGHLDNRDAARYLAGMYHPDIRHILLCHLSEENNTPELALESIAGALAEKGITTTSRTVEIAPGVTYLAALPRYQSSELYIL